MATLLALPSIAKKCSLLHVLKLLGDETVLTTCVLGLNECNDKKPCPLHSQYRQIKPKLIDMLNQKTIQQLADEMKDQKMIINQDMTKTVLLTGCLAGLASVFVTSKKVFRRLPNRTGFGRFSYLCGSSAKDDFYFTEEW